MFDILATTGTHNIYTLDKHLARSIVYIKVSHRHLRSKFNQLRAGTQAFFEKALRIWRTADTYEHHLTIALETRPSETQLRALGQALIATYRPVLNAPFVYILLRKPGV